MSLIEMREQFEQDARKRFPNANFNRKASDASYASPKTQGWWVGYMLYHNSSWSVEGGDCSRPVGKFIVAKVSPLGTVHPSNRPWMHRTKRLAKDEARRLSMQCNQSFAILRCIDVKHPKEAEPTTDTH